MSSTLPKSQAILNYRDFFGVNQPENPLLLLEGFDRATILGEITGLNYRLKPKTTMYYDTSLKKQQSELFWFSGHNEQLFKKYYELFGRHIYGQKHYPLIFTRQTCLYAAEQIIHSSLSAVDGFTMEKAWVNLFEYLLTVNTEITKQTNQISDKPMSLEELGPRLLPLNELSIDVNPIYTPYRGHELLNFFSTHPELGPYFSEYFRKTYGLPYDHFVYELMSMFYANNKDGTNNLTLEATGETIDTSFYYSVNPDEVHLFNSLANIYPTDKIERIISIRKFPFVQLSEKTFLLTDGVLLLDKAYSQFINDFWFDCVRAVAIDGGKPRFPPRFYRGEIGKFLELYTTSIIKHSFQRAKYHTIKLFDELKIKIVNDEIEITDIYIRFNNKIFLAEVKSTGLYDEEKYSGDINALYKNNREKFFKSFGVNQLVNSIATLKDRIKIVDAKFPADHRCHIYPALIVNERALQTPLMAHIFNKRFDELMQERVLDNLHVHELSLLHISDLEQMEDHLHLNPKKFWKILQYHLREPTFIPPFF